MLAMPRTDLIIAAVWVGGLSLLLLGQAFIGWLRLQYAKRSARHASRLSEATEAGAHQHTGASLTPPTIPAPGSRPLTRTP